MGSYDGGGHPAIHNAGALVVVPLLSSGRKQRTAEKKLFRYIRESGPVSTPADGLDGGTSAFAFAVPMYRGCSQDVLVSQNLVFGE